VHIITWSVSRQEKPSALENPSGEKNIPITGER